VREVASGYECGLLVEHNDVAEGDILELFEVVEVERK
jgi:translation initiation factor IF-2